MLTVCKLSVLHIASMPSADQGLPRVDICLLETVNHCFMLSQEGGFTVSADLYSVGRAIQGHRAPRFLTQSTPAGTLLRKIVSVLS